MEKKFSIFQNRIIFLKNKVSIKKVAKWTLVFNFCMFDIIPTEWQFLAQYILSRLAIFSVSSTATVHTSHLSENNISTSFTKLNFIEQWSVCYWVSRSLMRMNVEIKEFPNFSTSFSQRLTLWHPQYLILKKVKL